MEAKLAELKRRLGEVSDLRSAAAVLDWDQMVMMPPAGAAVRAERLATLERVAHEAFVDDRIGVLLEELRPLEESLPHDADDASLIRVARRDYDKAVRVPVRARGGDHEDGVGGHGGVGRGTCGERLRGVPALARPAPRAQAPLRRLLRPARRPV